MRWSTGCAARKNVPPWRRRGSPWSRAAAEAPWFAVEASLASLYFGLPQVFPRDRAHTHKRAHTPHTPYTPYPFFFFFNKSTVILAPGPTRSAAAWAPQELSLTCICVPRCELVQSTRVWPPFWRRGSPWSAVLAPWFAVLAKIDGWTPFGLGRRP